MLVINLHVREVQRRDVFVLNESLHGIGGPFGKGNSETSQGGVVGEGLGERMSNKTSEKRGKRGKRRREKKREERKRKRNKGRQERIIIKEYLQGSNWDGQLWMYFQRSNSIIW